MYVADEGNHRIQALSLSGRPLYAEGTFGKEPGEFVNPFGVAVHGARVYAVDDNNNRIVVLSRTLRYLEEWSGEGSFQLSYIRAAAVSPSGHVYVADTGHERVVAFTPIGQGLLAFGTPGISPGELIAPLGVAADGARRVRGRDLRLAQPDLPVRRLSALSRRVAAGWRGDRRQPLVWADGGRGRARRVAVGDRSPQRARPPPQLRGGLPRRARRPLAGPVG